jgi:DNA repair protein RecN (Recombination protein N)
VIESLHISGLGVIDNAEVDLRDGLTVITGETGAGKTMLVTSLSLLTGQRATAELVRNGAERAQITARLVVGAAGAAAERASEAGGVVEDGELVVVRSVAKSGRSRAAVGGAAAPLSVLSEVGAVTVAIHGQNDQVHLVAGSRQRQLLDRYGGLPDLVAQVEAAHASLTAVCGERDDVRDHRQEREREADVLRFGLQEIRRTAPQPDEDKQLEQEADRLAHAVELKETSARAAELLNADERSVIVDLGEVNKSLETVRAHDRELDEIARQLSDVGYLVADAVSALTRYSERVEADPGRLDAAQQRRAQLTALTRKYGPTIADVLAWSADAKSRLDEVDDTSGRLERLEAEITAITERLASLVTELSTQRQAAAERLAQAATAELKALSMPDAELVVEVQQREVAPHDSPDAEQITLPDGRTVALTSTGADVVSFLLRPHNGAQPVPLNRGASGGELSRVMLALEVVLAGADPVPTLVFDEVDAGVGGSAAVEVGRRLARLANDRQVLVVTHLPQVAAFADRHLVVRKSSTDHVTSADVLDLDDQGRVQELTRMLAGLADSQTGQAHAEELLEVARSTR